jgi:hypothetical protein
MKISGFTFSRNASKLGYPFKESIESILPIVDEFIVVLGDSEPDDQSEEIIRSIPSEKVKVINTVWDLEAYPRGMEHAHQTDIAKQACKGDWLFYLQADELIHEKDHRAIVDRCAELLDDKEVEGLLFNYHHFWGDYWHVHYAHGWYQNEIRIIRNDPDIHSWESAQSFRRIPNFDGKSYRQQEGTQKLKVAKVNADIYHYGWVRPPHLMKTKSFYMSTNHHGRKAAESKDDGSSVFDYGPLSLADLFKGTHPKVMQKQVEAFDWKSQLYEKGPIPKRQKLFKHEKLKNRWMGRIERGLFGKQLFTFKNYELIR